jgi:voltage-gated potassium channel
MATKAPENERSERWRALEQLDDWLRTPMLLLSLSWVGIVLMELLRGSSRLLEIFGTGIWLIFILEFLLRFALAPEKLPFLRSNWLTILSLIVPALRIFRGLRLLRAGRALRGARLVRIVGTANRSMNALKSTLRRRQFHYVAGLTILVVTLGAAGMLSFEPRAKWRAASPPIGTRSGGRHAGQHDRVRLLAADDGRTDPRLPAAVYGLAVFGYITASFASFFVGREPRSRQARWLARPTWRRFERRLQPFAGISTPGDASHRRYETSKRNRSPRRCRCRSPAVRRMSSPVSAAYPWAREMP